MLEREFFVFILDIVSPLSTFSLLACMAAHHFVGLENKKNQKSFTIGKPNCILVYIFQ